MTFMKRIGTSVIATMLLASCAPETSIPLPGKTEKRAAYGDWGVDLTGMDTSVKPGDDFYLYANNSWFKEYDIPADKSGYGTMIILRDRAEENTLAIIKQISEAQSADGSIEQKIADLYNSYMNLDKANELGAKALSPIMDQISAIDNMDDLVQFFAEAPLNETDGPFAANVTLDSKNPNDYFLQVTQSGLSLPDRDFYLIDNPRFEAIRQAFLANISQMLQFFDISPEQAEADALAIMALETKLAQDHMARVQLRNPNLTYNVMPFDEFVSEYVGFPWQKFFQLKDFGKPEKVNVRSKEALKSALKIINETPLETWRAYLRYHAIVANADFLSDEIAEANFQFYGRTLRGQPQRQEREKRAIQLVSSELGEAIGQIYVEKYFDQEAKKQMDTLVNNLLDAYEDRISALEWMSDEAKQRALIKLSTFRPKIGYPNKWRDYSTMDISPDDLMGNIMAARAYYRQDEIRRIGQKTDKDEWFLPPQTVNAYYNPLYNEVVFPAAILQPPFFDQNADLAVNYGAIGAVIGHEIGHGFDDQGRNFDENGILRNWWQEEDIQKFGERTSVLVEQYSGYSPVEGHFVNGNLTLGENIADLAGVSISYHAYKKAAADQEDVIIDGFNGSQRFFLSYAQVWRSKYRDEITINRLKTANHSPAEFRVNGIVRNVDAWYDAFDVQPGDALYLLPEVRAKIW